MNGNALRIDNNVKEGGICKKNRTRQPRVKAHTSKVQGKVQYPAKVTMYLEDCFKQRQGILSANYLSTAKYLCKVPVCCKEEER